MIRKHEAALSLQEQKNLILNILDDFCTDADTLFRYLDHVGFDIGSVSHAREIPTAFLGHYRLKNGTYDVDRACHHLATWPPIAARIAEMRLEQRGV